MTKITPNWGVGIALGMGTGIALGTALDNIGLGVGMGGGLMIVYAIALGKRAASPDGEDANGENPPISSSETPDNGSGKASGGDE